MSGLPNMWGEDWVPTKPLDLVIEINAKIAKIELLRFIVERHDGHLQLISSAWEQVVSKRKTTTFDGDSWHKFSIELVKVVVELLGYRVEPAGLEKYQDLEIIPKRELNLYLNRKSKRFAIDLHLVLRRIAYYHTISLDLRKKWHRLMLRTRATDEHLKSLFMQGVETPNGEKFGG